MKIEQFVMAYRAEQDRLRALLPEEFTSLRPVLRMNGEIRKGSAGEQVYLEFNTPVEGFGKRGWLNIAHWNSSDDDLSCACCGNRTTFSAPFVEITFTKVGVSGGCPAEKDNDGCFYLDRKEPFVPAEQIDSYKEFCDCSFAWHFHDGDAKGCSIGEKTMAAVMTPPLNEYEKTVLSAENAAAIACEQILGAYAVCFTR